MLPHACGPNTNLELLLVEVRGTKTYPPLDLFFAFMLFSQTIGQNISHTPTFGDGGPCLINPGSAPDKYDICNSVKVDAFYLLREVYFIFHFLG